jgi:uncharacterized repeat protein (TIGR01451 family)
MSRFRVGLAVVAITMTALALPGAITAGGGVANAPLIPGGDITAVCMGTTNGTTFTLTADCGPVSTSLTVPATITTVDGAGHTISADDAGAAQFNGGIVTNAGPGQTMNIQNLTISGPVAGFQLCTNSGNVLYGIFFTGAAGGSVSNVTVQHIFQFQNGAFGSCQTGRAIRADNSGTITITGTTVTDYQKSGFEARGSTIMNVSGSTAGPSHPLEGSIAQNGVSYVGAAGTVANNTIFGSGDAQAGVGGGAAGTAVLLFGAHDVTVTNNTLTSPAAPRPGTDFGISVTAGSSTGIVISFNRVNRLGPDIPDTWGNGIDVFTPDGSMATLICNTFSQWRTNVVGAEQIACTPLPNGSECQAYSAPAPVVDSGKNYDEGGNIIDATPFTWTVDSGTLPPGLSLSSGGAITGTPTAAGTFNFTMKVADSTGLTATQAQTITIAPDCAPPPTTKQSTVQVVKTWVGTPSTTTIFVDANGQAPFDASVVADTNGATTSFTYPVSTSVTVGETTVPTGYTATIDCGQGAQTYSAPIRVNAPATAGATLVCTIVDTKTPRPKPPRPKLVLRKVSNKHVVHSGDRIRFTITIRALGKGKATNARVCDMLPPGLVFVRVPGATFRDGRACWRIASISAGHRRSYHVTVRANSVQRATVRTNVATVVAPRTNCAARRASQAASRSEATASLSRCGATARVLVRPHARNRAGGVTG